MKHQVNKEIIAFVKAMEEYGFTLHDEKSYNYNGYWTYHFENGCEKLDYDIRIVQDDENNLLAEINKSYDNSCTQSMEDSTATVHLLTIWEYLNFQGLQTKKDQQYTYKLIDYVKNHRDRNTLQSEIYDFLYEKGISSNSDNLQNIIKKTIEYFGLLTTESVAILKAYAEYNETEELWSHM